MGEARVEPLLLGSKCGKVRWIRVWCDAHFCEAGGEGIRK